MNLKKVTAEIVGSALYGSLTEFLRFNRDHDLKLSSEECDKVFQLFEAYVDHRLNVLERSFYRIRGLADAINEITKGGELEELLFFVGRWFSKEQFDEIRRGSLILSERDIKRFLLSLRHRANDYASSEVCVLFIQEQLEEQSEIPTLI